MSNTTSENTNESGGKNATKRPWTEEEDALLMNYVDKFGAEKWDEVQKRYNLNRTGKSCRFRYVNNLDQKVNKAPFTPAEEDLIFRRQAELGNKWATIAKELPGRTDNQIKNYWNTRNKKRKKTALVPALPAPAAVPAQSYTENPSQRIGNSNRGDVRTLYRHHRNPQMSFQSPTFHPWPLLCGSPGFNDPFFSRTRLQEQNVFIPNPLVQYCSNAYGTSMISENRVSTGGAIVAKQFAANEMVEPPSFQNQYRGGHDTDANGSVSSCLGTIYSDIHPPAEAVPMQSNCTFTEYTSPDEMTRNDMFGIPNYDDSSFDDLLLLQGHSGMEMTVRTEPVQKSSTG